MSSAHINNIKARIQAHKEARKNRLQSATPFSFDNNLLDKLQLIEISTSQGVRHQLTLSEQDLTSVQQEHKSHLLHKLEAKQNKLHATKSRAESEPTSEPTSEPEPLSQLAQVTNGRGEVNVHALNLLLVDEVKKLKARLDVLEEKVSH